jgi:uncharacterized protein YciI
MTRRTLPFALAALVVALAAASRAGAVESGDTLPPNMTTYFFGVLVKGPKWSPEETPERAAIMEGHLAHLRAMNTAGKLVLAGPLMDGGDWRGILIYRTKSIEEAQRLADDDPAVKAGRLQVTMHPWLVQKGVLPDPLDSGAEKPK